MTETRTPYTTTAPQPQRLVVTLTIDLDNDAVAQYLVDKVSANPLTRERGADAQRLDYALLDFLLEAVQPRHPLDPHSAATGGNGDGGAFEADYQGRAWLRNFQLTATVGAGAA